MTAPGYFGSVLVVDVGTGAARVDPLPDDVLRAYIGGVGLGTWLLHAYAPVGVDPLGPEAPLAFVFSPLVGTPLTTSAKFAVVAKSPLTGMLTDALASSHFAIAGKLTGHDAIVVVGRADRPTVLLVDGGVVRVEPADDVWGRSAADTDAELRRRHGRSFRVAAIGPAGERLVRFATISHDRRHAGRGGLGAVLGAKNVKAVAVRAGDRRVPAADPPGLLAAARDLRERSFGPATAKFRELGTLANLLAFNAVSALPSRNFRDAGFEGAPDIGPEQLADLRGTTRSSCAACTVGCEHIYRRKGAKKPVRVEYQNVFALGSLCAVGDHDLVLEATARCDELGLDTISAGGTIAWAMECVEHGLLDVAWLRFGDGRAVLRALDEMVAGTDLGQLLALGSRAAAAQLGGDAPDMALHVKGLELPGYDPRTLHSAAVGLAVNARGADHNRSGASELADLTGDLDRLDGGAAHALAAVAGEDRAAVMDSLILCNFLRGVFDDPFVEWAHLLGLVTGWDVDAAELRSTAGRIVLSKRAFNEREGWQPGDDWLPPRLLDRPVVLPSGREARLTAERLRTMIDAYYAARGLAPDGRLPAPAGAAARS